MDAGVFGLESRTLRLVVIVALWLLVVATLWAFARVDRRAAALVVPSLLWVTFAAPLNHRFLVLNWELSRVDPQKPARATLTR